MPIRDDTFFTWPLLSTSPAFSSHLRRGRRRRYRDILMARCCTDRATFAVLGTCGTVTLREKQEEGGKEGERVRVRGKVVGGRKENEQRGTRVSGKFLTRSISGVDEATSNM